MSATATVTAPPPETTTRNWEQIGNVAVLLAYSCVVLFTVRYHEKWADEAQAWLIARDLDLKTIWFHEARYEGAPGLWHTILWIAQHWFHAPYAALGYIGVAFAIAGVALLVFKSPFPWYVRWPLAFTYVMVYQYAVIARPYTILPLLCFAVAIFFKDVQHPGRMTMVLVLLANLSLHGAILAGCFGLLYLIGASKKWREFDNSLRNRYFVCAAAMVLTFLFLVVILKPTPDIEEFMLKKEFAQMPESLRQQMRVPTALQKATNVVSGAFLDFLYPSVAFLILAAAWSFTRQRLLGFVLPVGLMVALYSVIHGAPHHHGTAFIAAITTFWIAWPTADERRAFNPRNAWAMRAMIPLLLILSFVNIWDAVVVIKREYLYPYSGSADAVRYLKSVGADRGPMFGLLYGVVAVQAYFDHNIFANVTSTYFHHGMPLLGTYLDTEALQRIQPEYVIAYTNDPQQMLESGVPQLTSRGYEIVHFSDGYYMYKQAVFQRDCYFIFRRVHPGDGQTPPQLNPDK
jgi:hypothetical protein